MHIAASIRNAGALHEATVTTSGVSRTIPIAAKQNGLGSSVNGGELLMLALATCYGNDLYREAARLGIPLRGVEVLAEADFEGVGVAATLGALVLGLALGLTAAYLGGKTDAVIMRLVDIQLSFPAILIALILLAFFGQGLGKIIVALIAVQRAYYARTVRSAALVEMGKEYIEAARCLHLSHRHIILHHLLPNCLPPLIVVAAMQVAAAIEIGRAHV